MADCKGNPKFSLVSATGYPVSAQEDGVISKEASEMLYFSNCTGLSAKLAIVFHALAKAYHARWTSHHAEGGTEGGNLSEPHDNII